MSAKLVLLDLLLEPNQFLMNRTRSPCVHGCSSWNTWVHCRLSVVLMWTCMMDTDLYDKIQHYGDRDGASFRPGTRRNTAGISFREVELPSEIRSRQVEACSRTPW